MPIHNGRESNYVPPSMDGLGDDFGSFFDDPLGTVEGVVSDVGDTISSVVPDVLKDKFKEFAGSTIGHVVLFAASGGAYAILAPTLGPQVAAVAFALPGMAKGENFMKAWTEGFTERITILIKYFMSTGVPQDQAAQSATNLFTDQMQTVQHYVDSIGGVAKLGGMDFKTLAEKAGVREDVAAEYLANAVGNLSLPTSYNFDPATGKATGPSNQSWQDKTRLVAASIDPSLQTTAAGKGKAIGNIMILSQQQAQKEASARAAATTHKASRATLGAGLGVMGALLFGASLPVVAGAGAALGLLGLLTAKGE